MWIAAKRMVAGVTGLQLSSGWGGSIACAQLTLPTFSEIFFGSLGWRPVVLAPLCAKVWAAREFRSQSCRGVRAQKSGDVSGAEGPKLPARLALRKQELDADVAPDVSQPVPKISLEHVTLSFARSGGAGGQNVNKVSTKVDMRFNVMAANWLPERVKAKLMQTEKNRINSEGEMFISSTKTRTQKGNIEDALAKLQQLIDAAAYEPPPVSEEKKKRIEKLAKVQNERRLDDKKRMAFKKSIRRNKASWD